ncbi:PTS mannitol transporter subunit IICB [Raineyella sp. W15-4]|uniref:PTS mannitol transporter subunit IICB n=1 Tax=Raineyella sp. W15-4 TaxID=3081651 RepID=UPI002954B33D|nr:PTS mannitol transporter subunit IICB [Raineyella sp. W15-4]WOQ17360.1 PTS mannitol transporter subunit IICB [Raineyella sp. W15-4]
MSSNAPNARARVQAFGGFLTAMVIPNMGAFIAWGFLTALFIPTGWLPNDYLAQLNTPIIHYILPSLLAYTGGTLIHGKRGGVIGVIGTVGLIVGADIPMFLGAMIMGPFSAWILKQFDRFTKDRIRPGFEMIVDNFSLGLIGLGLCLLSYVAVGPAVLALNKALTVAVGALISTGFLPVLAVLNEPAKVLFLNNVIDQGIYYPLGMQQAAEAGKSILFCVASNPGAGLGLLCAFWKFGETKELRDSAPGAIIIHFLGGIHEIYFPYVLMKPLTLIGMILGSGFGIATLQLLGGGLVAGPSPGSIISYLLLTPRGDYSAIIAAVLVAGTVSFVVNSLILRFDQRRSSHRKTGNDLADFQARSTSMKNAGKDVLSGVLKTTETEATAANFLTSEEPNTSVPVAVIRKVVFACDAGMGSSAMGASIFSKNLKKQGSGDIEVTHVAIEDIPGDADVVVVHQDLAGRARKAKPDARLVTIQNYLNDPHLEELLASVTPVAKEV